MRASSVLAVFLLVALVLVFGAGLGWFQGGGDAPPAPAAHGAPAVDHAGHVGPMAQASGLPSGTVATRIAARPAAVTPLADAATACLRIVDHVTERVVAGAAVRRLQGGVEIGFSDDQGLVEVALREAEQLAVVVDGYLLRLVPTHLGTSAAEPQIVRLVPDRWSLRRRFHFVGPDQQPVAAAFVRFRPQDAAPRPAKSPVPADDPVLQRAWMEHTMLAGRPACADVAVQLGGWNEDRVHPLADGAEVRFVAPGTFTLELATTTGLVGTASVTVAANGGDAAPVTLGLQMGSFVAGYVIALADGKPLAGASLQVQGGEPLGLVATTGADGAFQLGPLLRGPLTLHVRHGDHEPLAYGPVTAPSSGLRVPLRALPQTTLRGRVRSRPSLRPLVGASLQWVPEGGGNPITAVTQADGTFVLPATGHGSGRLYVRAPRHVAYAELVEVGAPFADFDVWPAEPDERVELGLTAILEGTVFDDDGAPVPGATVRWAPAQPTAPATFTGRRVLEGAVLQLPLGATTGADGTFRIETNQFGSGRLTTAGSDPGLTVEAVAGKTQNRLRLQR